MTEVYEKRIRDPFAGRGVETVVVEQGTVATHTRGWDDPAVVDDQWNAPLRGQSWTGGHGWHKLEGVELENALVWAEGL